MQGNMTKSDRKLHRVGATDIGMSFDGLPETRFAFETFKGSVQKKLTRMAMSAAVRVVAKEAKRLAPRDSGLLKESIGSKSKTYDSGVTVGIVGPRRGFRRTVDRRAWQSGERALASGKRQVVYKTLKRIADPANYAHLVEYGTKPHTLGGGSSLRAKGTLAAGQYGATHPGTTGQRFMARSWENKKGEAMAKFNQTLAAGVRRELDRLSSKARAKV
jgi:HK97 gp10 family phage protein